MTEEEKMYSLLNELNTEKAILENTLAQKDLSGYDKDLLEQYQEELDLYKRTIDYIEKLQKENKELKEKVFKRDKELIRLEEYANKNFERKDDVKAKYIPKEKIRELANYFENGEKEIKFDWVVSTYPIKVEDSKWVGKMLKELLEEEEK